MRRLSRFRSSDEQGAVIILMTAFILVIVVIAALVVDIGALPDEKRQIQNGADAAALAIAQRCAVTGFCPLADSRVAMAEGLANGNALDGATKVDSVVVNQTNQTVTVRTRTLDHSRSNTILPYFFAQSFSDSGGESAQAKATATWAGLRKAAVIPLAISQCDFDTATSGGTVFEVDRVVFFHDTLSDKCPGGYGSSGEDFPGGFGWVVDDDSKDCNISLSVNDTVVGDTGTPGTPRACLLASMVGKDVLIPIYDGLGKGTEKTENGKWKYHIMGFAQFHLTGYQFPTQKPPTSPCAKGSTCIGGYFVKFVAIGESGGPSLGRRPALVS